MTIASAISCKITKRVIILSAVGTVGTESLNTVFGLTSNIARIGYFDAYI